MAPTDGSGYDLLIAGGAILTPAGLRNANLAVAGGVISAVMPAGARPAAREVVEAGGLHVLPALFDMHVHFREPGGTHKEDFATGTAAAAVGGYSGVAEMPNTVPPTTTAARLEEKRRRAEGRAHVDFALWGGAGRPDDVAELARASAVGIKVYLGLDSGGETHADAPDELVVPDDAALAGIFEAAAEAGLVVAVHCGDRALRNQVRDRWRGRGIDDLREEIAREPQLHKVQAVGRALALAADVGARVHIVHVPAPALPLVRLAKDAGAKVTVESALPFMTHDLLDTAAELGFDRYRSVADADALWAAARDGTVDVLATDHAPHTIEEKRGGRRDLLAMPSGYPELDTALPMLLDAVNRDLLTLARLVELTGSGPRRILGVGGRGTIEAGEEANLVLVDLARRATIDATRFQTRSRWSPYEGREVTGWPVATYMRGVPIAREGTPTGTSARGRFLAPRA